MLSIPIIYEDNHLVVVEKPVNVLSQADRTGDPDMLTLLKQDLKERYNKPGNVYLGLVHRLDRPVGGVMVLPRLRRQPDAFPSSLLMEVLRRSTWPLFTADLKICWTACPLFKER